VPNSAKAWEIEAYTLLVAEIRAALGPGKLISAAVPGLERDMLAFTPATVPRLMASLDFLNVMTYDMMNRRDNITKHHTGVALSLAAVDAYISRGARPQDVNLGFAFYVKWFQTKECEPGSEVGCPTVLMEDPATGADLGGSGGFAWHDPVPEDVRGSFERALAHGMYDKQAGGHYYWDREERRWWTFDDPAAILRKFPAIMEARGLGGVFAWGLGEDGPEWRHLRALNKGLDVREHVRDEL
jgi:GH18 family chitinase